MEKAPIHLSFYRFRDLGEEAELRELQVSLKRRCAELGLKGTILLAREGVNAMLCGTRESIEEIKAWAREACGAIESDFKEATSPPRPFQRMLVKIKKEIITVGDPTLRPMDRTAKRVTATELKAWLDEGRPMLLLDTRNEYEIGVGTFEKAASLGIDHSRQFAEKAREKLDELKRQPVVTFCTGGIRCEKASAYLLELGVPEVYQLDGGILRYFESVGGAHYRGHCFVFDDREAVDPALQAVKRSTDPERQFGRHKRV